MATGQAANQTKLIKPSRIPIYGDLEVPAVSLEATKEADAAGEGGQAYDSAVSGVREARLVVQAGWGRIYSVKERLDHIVNTGIAHTAGTLALLRDSDNVAVQAGFVGGAGLVGFVLGSLARRARFFKRLLYTSIGAGSAASICYPAEAKAISNIALEEGKSLSLIAYNFVAGVQPRIGQTLSGSAEATVEKTNNEASAATTKESESSILSEEDKKDLSTTTSDAAAALTTSAKKEKSVNRDQSNPDDKDMYSTRGGDA